MSAQTCIPVQQLPPTQATTPPMRAINNNANGALWCGSIALLAGALAHVISCRHMAPPPASLEAWESLATQACIQLLEVCTSHPNQKKVFTAVITKHLLLLLSQAIWPPPRHLPQATPQSRKPPSAADDSDVALTRISGLQLTAAAQQVLRAVIFHSSSIDGVIQLGACFNSSQAPGSAATGNPAEDPAPRSYHFQLLQVCRPLPRAIVLPYPAEVPSILGVCMLPLRNTCHYRLYCIVHNLDDCGPVDNSR